MTTERKAVEAVRPKPEEVLAAMLAGVLNHMNKSQRRKFWRSVERWRRELRIR